MENKENINKFFNKKDTVRNYSNNFKNEFSGINFSFRKRLSLVSSMIERKIDSILDIGVGTGEITSKIIEENQVQAVTIIDVSDKMLSAAKDNILKLPKEIDIKCINSDFETLDPLTGKFDLILCLGLIAYLDDFEGFLVKLKKHLKPDSEVIIQSSLSNNIGLKLMYKLSFKRNLSSFGFKTKIYELEELRSILKRNNFVILKEIRYLLSIPYANKLSSLNYFLEFIFQPISKYMGSEILLKVSHKE